MKTRFGACVFLPVLLAVSPLAGAACAEPADYSVYPHLDHTEFLDGRSAAVTSYSLWDRDFFAVVNEQSSLHLFEVVGDEVVARGIGHTTGADVDVAVLGWHAFVATSSGLSVVSVAVPDTPFQVGFLNLPAIPLNMALSATHAFLAYERDGLVVVDITDPANMQVVFQGFEDYVTSLWYDDGRLGIINDKSFELLDVTDPTAPVQLGALYLGTYNNQCVIGGELAYLSTWYQVKRVDISDPAAMSILETLPIGSVQIPHRLVTGADELMYVGAEGLHFVDFASGALKRTSRQVGLVRSGAAIGGKIMAAGDDRVEFFADGAHANPSAVEVGNGDLVDQRGVILGDYLYGLSRTEPNRLVATEVDVGAYLWWNLDLAAGGSVVRGLAHRDRTIVAVTSLGTLSIVDVTRSEATLLSQLDLADGFYTAYEIDRTVAFLDDETLVVLDQKYGSGSDHHANFRVVDISDPAQPEQIAQYPLTLLYPEYLMVAGDLVLAASYAEYEVFEAEDRLAMQSRGVHHGGATGNGSSKFYTAGSFLNILLHEPRNPYGDIVPDRLETWDLADPATPVLVSQFNLASPGRLAFAGDYAYQGESGLVIDFSDPARPVPAGNFSPQVDFGLPRVEVQAGSDIVVAEYRTYGTDPERITLYLPAQGASGPVSAVGGELPAAESALTLQAVPNPFNPRVTFSFELAAGSTARLQVFDLRGRLVADLGEEAREAGSHEVTWDGVDRWGRNLPSGVYLARISTPAGAASRKIVLAR